MVNSFTNGSVAMPITEEPIIICPVDETGKNSVNPSIIARIKACKKLIEFYFFKMAYMPKPKPNKTTIGAIKVLLVS